MLIRILLAEDVSMVRGALVALLNLEPDLDVVAEVGAGDAIVGAALAARPDVAVIDVHLPRMRMPAGCSVCRTPGPAARCTRAGSTACGSAAARRR